MIIKVYKGGYHIINMEKRKIEKKDDIYVVLKPLKEFEVKNLW